MTDPIFVRTDPIPTQEELLAIADQLLGDEGDDCENCNGEGTLPDGTPCVRCDGKGYHAYGGADAETQAD
jgi:hypothetical protein